jgi:CHAD domain-containing protein
MYADKLYHRFLKTVSKHDREITPKKVHLLRTTSRRLQTALAADAGLDDKLHRQLRKIRRQAGRVRDLDVQLAALKTIHLPSTAAEHKRVERTLERTRERRAHKLRQFLSEYTPSLRQPKRQSSESRLGRNPAQDPLHSALDSFAAAAGTFSAGTNSDLHAFRIAAKKARYTAELAQTEPQAANVIAALKAIQDAIGDWHDWAILGETATNVLGHPQHSPLLSVLHKKIQIRLARARRVAMENTKHLLALHAALAEPVAPPAQKKQPVSVKLRQRAARAL